MEFSSFGDEELLKYNLLSNSKVSTVLSQSITIYNLGVCAPSLHPSVGVQETQSPGLHNH